MGISRYDILLKSSDSPRYQDTGERKQFGSKSKLTKVFAETITISIPNQLFDSSNLKI